MCPWLNMICDSYGRKSLCPSDSSLHCFIPALTLPGSAVKDCGKVLRFRSCSHHRAELQLAVKRCQNHDTMSESCICWSSGVKNHFNIIFKMFCLGENDCRSREVFIFTATARMLSRLKYQLCLFHGESKHAFLISSDITGLCLIIIHSEIVNKEPELTRLNDSRSPC